MRNVLAMLLARRDCFGRTEAEVLSAAVRLSGALGGTLSAGLLGPADDSWVESCFAFGAGRVLHADHPALGEYRNDLYVAAAQQCSAAAQAEMLLLPGTTYGLEIAPVLGYKLGASVTLDCIELRGNAVSGQVTLTKPVYGGKANLELAVRTPPAVVAMRPRTVVPLNPQVGRRGDVLRVEVQLDVAAARTRLVERRVEESGASRLEDARTIVSGGRGLGGKENFALLEQLAGVLGGTLGASRAACDLGWAPASWQIGQTGKKVAPDLYIAVGISGASQHMVGCSGAKHLVAINKDSKAPIFRAAELGVVEDYRAFIPALIEALRRRKAS